jgi:hypothetical protein
MMRFADRGRRRATVSAEDEDPLAGIANLFDVSVAFIVALLIALFTLLSSADMLNPDSNVTLVRQNSDGTMDIISKQRSRIQVQRVTKESMSGDGQRLGVAYRLPGGEVVYVPEGEAPPAVGATPVVKP